METMKIGDFARKAGVNVQTVRYYERRGLLPEPERRESGYREYTRDGLERLQFIRRSQELGFTLSEIEELLSLRTDPHTAAADVKARAEAKVADIEAKIQDLGSGGHVICWTRGGAERILWPAGGSTMKRVNFGLRLSLLAVLAVSLGGCLAAAAGAGAAAAIAYNERGVSSRVEGAPAQIFQRSEAVFREMGITESGRQTGDDGTEHQLKGRSGELEITVDIKRDSDTLSAVEVFAQKSAVDYDREYARRVLEAIIQRS